MKKISTIVFDLGGVLYDINLQRTRDSLALLAGRDIDFTLTSQHPVFDLFESGKMSPDEFRRSLREVYSINASDEDLDAAWNALLVGEFPYSLEIIQSLNNSYQVAMLSNTNELHHARVLNECQTLLSEFDHLFFSCKLGMRKPQPQIFEHLLSGLQIPAHEVLYLDDAPQHIAAAKALGIQTVHVNGERSVRELLNSALAQQS